MVYYRVLNTALFLWGLTSAHVTIMQMVPMLIIGQLPSFWFFCSVLLDAELRKRAHKLVIGFSINKLISPIMSLIIFTKVATNLGSQGKSCTWKLFSRKVLTFTAWGMSGVTASTAAPAAASTTEGSDEESGDLSAAEKGECGLSMTEKSEDDGKRKGPSTKKRRDLDIDIDGDC